MSAFDDVGAVWRWLELDQSYFGDVHGWRRFGADHYGGALGTASRAMVQRGQGWAFEIFGAPAVAQDSTKRAL
jgi:hypothetical protein